MKRPLTLVFVIVMTAFAAGRAAADSQQKQDKKLKVLVTTGGHAFEVGPFYAIFDAMPDVEYARAELPRDAGLLQPGLEEKYDVVVMYDMSPPITPDQRKAFAELLAKGIGLVSLHHNLGAHRDWEDYRKIIGGKFVFQDCEIDGNAYSKTPWSHDEDLAIQIADSDHPITKGVGPFSIHDETYGKFYTTPGIHVLLKTDHPKNNPEVAWTTKYGNSPVFYLMLGHDSKAYANPSFREILHRGIRWAAGR
ncbi:MAG: ThuA domain-containing protein [Pirellulales bacterium]|nr:ThuA domain-containing protein [Pirellulales bacterium]